MKFENKCKWLKQIQESKQINEGLNTKEVNDALEDVYKGYGWAELEYFTNYLSGNVNLNELEKFINTSGIAKVKKVSEIKNSSNMEDFDASDFSAVDKIIVTKRPGSNRFYGESEQTNEATAKYNRIDFDNIGGAFNIYVDEAGYGSTAPVVRIGCVSKGANIVATKTDRNADVKGDLDNIVKDMLTLTNKFEKDMYAMLAKYGYKKA